MDLPTQEKSSHSTTRTTAVENPLRRKIHPQLNELPLMTDPREEYNPLYELLLKT